MSIAELRKLPAAEKMRIIEALWDDLASDDVSFASPAWHEEALRETETEFAAGNIEVLDWESAKKGDAAAIRMNVRIVRVRKPSGRGA